MFIFKKAYVTIYGESLFKILEEFGVDNKTLEIINKNPSEYDIFGTISRPFKIITGIRQGDSLSPILFYCVLEKDVREWRLENEKHGVNKYIKLGRSHELINSVAFADYLVIIIENLVMQRNDLNSNK